MITKNPVVSIQNLAVNYEPRPVMSNPGVSHENNQNVDYITLEKLIAEVSELVCKSKDDYHK